jgi:hypothetical protein
MTSFLWNLYMYSFVLLEQLAQHVAHMTHLIAWVCANKSRRIILFSKKKTISYDSKFLQLTCCNLKILIISNGSGDLKTQKKMWLSIEGTRKMERNQISLTLKMLTEIKLL